jgi:hypothetical protein
MDHRGGELDSSVALAWGRSSALFVPRAKLSTSWADEIVAVVAETAGLELELVQAAILYWADYSAEVDAFVDRASSEA